MLVSAPLCRLLSDRHVSPPAPICPSFPSFSLLRDCLFCHYFLAAGGNSGNLVNPLTTNCPLLPCCLNKQNGGGGSQAPHTIKVTVKRQVATVTACILALLDHFTCSDFQAHFEPLLVRDVWETVDALPVFLRLRG